MWLRRWDVPITIVEHRLEHIPTVLAEHSNGATIRVRDGVSQLVEQRIGEIPVVYAADIKLDGVSILLEYFREVDVRVIVTIQEGVIPGVLVDDMVADRVEGFFQKPLIDSSFVFWVSDT